MSQKLDTIEPTREPEYVGVHSALSCEQCQEWHDANPPGEPFEPEQCTNDATHTAVLFDGKDLHEVAMCNDCGDPDDVDRYEREWTGELRDE